MIQSMTGFGSAGIKIPSLGRVSVEMRSTNHKFLEIAMHLPEGSLALEEEVKKAIESKIKRGRVSCALNIHGRRAGDVFINKALLKNYLRKTNSIKKEFRLKGEIDLQALMHLPGVLTFEEARISQESAWAQLKTAFNTAIINLVKTRLKEGKALGIYLTRQADKLQKALVAIKARLKKALKGKLDTFSSDEERANFLKDTDTTEEIDRLVFHVRNFKNKLASGGAVGKELDFIAQEMQRETNTLAAKTFDLAVSARVLQMKSQIEKIREQAQNIE